MIRHTGNVFVLSAPSGAGKSTLKERLVQEIAGLVFSVSFTTRPPREGEVDGRDYFFVSDETFDRMVAEGGFVEWVKVYEHRYGTGRAWIQVAPPKRTHPEAAKPISAPNPSMMAATAPPPLRRKRPGTPESAASRIASP